MVGEYLEKEKNPLAIKMGFYHQSRKLPLDSQFALQLNAALTNKVVIFVHGLTQLETIWDTPPAKNTNSTIVGHYIDACFETPKSNGDESYGHKLQDEFGYTPLYLRYNTGLSLEKNGRNFSTQLAQLFKVYPGEISELLLIGVSMGGNLLQHAQYSAQKSQSTWLQTVSKCVYLGNHNESPIFERMGYFRRDVIRYMDLWVKWGGQRNSGLPSIKQNMKCLRELQELDLEKTSYVESARHYFIKASGKKEQHLLSRVLGESSLTLNHAAVLDNSQVATIEGLSDAALTHSDNVYQLIASWVQDTEAGNVPLALINTEVPAEDVSNQEVSLITTAYSESPKLTLFAGVVDLFGSAYDSALETVETMHYSIAEEPFYAAHKLPLVSQIVKPIEKVHHNILNGLYRSLRRGGRMLHKAAAGITPDEGLVNAHFYQEKPSFPIPPPKSA